MFSMTRTLLVQMSLTVTVLAKIMLYLSIFQLLFIMSLFNHEFGSQDTYNVFGLKNELVYHLVTSHFLVWSSSFHSL